MDLELGNKTAIVTGSASTIGKAIAEGFAAENANVVVVDIDRDQALKVVDALNRMGDGEAIFIEADVTDARQIERMAEQTLERFGQIDILVNNAGWTANDLFLNKPVSDFEREIAINLWGPINCIRAIAPSMIERKYGKIITIGSDAGQVGEYNEAVYSACKGGVNMLSKALAREFGKYNLNINVVSPGLTLPESADDAGADSLWHRDSHQSKIFQNEETLAKVVKRYPLRRHAVPKDIVPLVLLLASDKSSYTTGQVISVSGGYAM